jgi:hypothetical protein
MAIVSAILFVYALWDQKYIQIDKYFSKSMLFIKN